MERWYYSTVSGARIRFLGKLPPGATRAEVIELLGQPEAAGYPSRCDSLLAYRDLTLQLFFTYGRLDLVGCYFDRGNPSEPDWPGPVELPPELRSGMTEDELVRWLETQDLGWSQVTSPGGVRAYVLGGDVRFYANDGFLSSLFIHCGLPAPGRDELLQVGVRLADRNGLENLTLGSLAQAVGQPKSWIACHFKTKERLRLAVEEHQCK